MKKPVVIIVAVTAYLAFYQASPYLGVPENIIFFLFAISPFFLVYMVYVVLRHGKPSSYTFEEKFYEDVEV